MVMQILSRPRIIKNAHTQIEHVNGHFCQSLALAASALPDLFFMMSDYTGWQLSYTVLHIDIQMYKALHKSLSLTASTFPRVFQDHHAEQKRSLHSDGCRHNHQQVYHGGVCGF